MKTLLYNIIYDLTTLFKYDFHTPADIVSHASNCKKYS